jgi:hypothetical protein
MTESIDIGLKTSDYVIAACTLLGPVLAVQAQKWLEGFREKRERRLTIFRTLMATRATNLSAAHVEALNAVPIDFYKDKKVMDAWEEYFAHLTNVPAGNPVWGQKRLDLFVKLLAAIGSRVGYDFNVAEMNRIYFPTAHGEMEDEQNTIRKGLATMLKGGVLPMAVKEFPSSPEAIDAQKTLIEKLSKAYAADGSLKVTIATNSSNAPHEEASRPPHAP